MADCFFFCSVFLEAVCGLVAFFGGMLNLSSDDYRFNGSDSYTLFPCAIRF
jgi:hypothetical protein